MSELQPTVRVDTGDPAETDDLLEALSVRGLAARRVGPSELEVEAPPEEAQVWNLEIVAALEAWLEESDHDSVVARLGSQSFTVKAPDRRVPMGDEEPAIPRRRGLPVLPIVLTGAIAVVLALVLWLLVS